MHPGLHIPSLCAWWLGPNWPVIFNLDQLVVLAARADGATSLLECTPAHVCKSFAAHFCPRLSEDVRGEDALLASCETISLPLLPIHLWRLVSLLLHPYLKLVLRCCLHAGTFVKLNI